MYESFSAKHGIEVTITITIYKGYTFTIFSSGKDEELGVKSLLFSVREWWVLSVKVLWDSREREGDCFVVKQSSAKFHVDCKDWMDLRKSYALSETNRCKSLWSCNGWERVDVSKKKREWNLNRLCMRRHDLTDPIG